MFSSELSEQIMLIPFLVFWYLAVLATCVVLIVMFVTTFFPDCCVREKEHNYVLIGQDVDIV